ncbi:MAG: beta-N-acetylhexosaminidase [Bacteroidales bacterium]|nr:beta-N-acetylhexosaminidase [Candidatus Cryptobacteroides aphodequi]
MKSKSIIFLSVLSLALASCACGAGTDNVKIVPNPVNKVETGRSISGKAADKVSTRICKRLEREEYRLVIGRCGVKIVAGSKAGIVWAEQTLDQIRIQSPEGTLPCLKIEDKPFFEYRGALLDCSRYFFPVEDVKNWIDIMATHKLNKFHWHLTDDQGWRLQLDCFPELTEKGSVRAQTKVGHYFDYDLGYDGTPYGGFYTKDEVREIVAYAAERGIDVIPEIEMPGHSQEVLAVFPQYGCTGGPYEVRQTWSISDDVLCLGKPGTLDFLHTVLDEVCDLFPGEYINIGGDEVHPDTWQACPDCQAFMKEHGMTDVMEIQRWLVGEIEQYLLAKGKKMIGWGEIFAGCTDPSTTVLSWRGTKTGIEAAEKGMHSVMCPGRLGMYLDYYQTPQCRKREPLAIHANWYTDLAKVYAYNPLEGIPAEKTQFVSGLQANLWTEYIPTLEALRHMALPRLAAAAETAWSGIEGKTEFEDFKARVHDVMLPVYEARGYNYAPYEWEEYIEEQ